MGSRLPRTAEAIAAGELRAAIVRGDLAPGEKVLQGATAEALGMSPIPLREALKTLAGEGVLEYLPRRGYFVPELPGEALVQVHEARALVEAATEQLAVPRLREEDLDAMDGHLRRQRRAAEDRDAVEMIACNRSFHFAIFDRCENPWLVRFTTQLWDAIDPYRVLSYRRMWLTAPADSPQGRHGAPADLPERRQGARADLPERRHGAPAESPIPDEILAEHARILAALRKGDGERALSRLKRHREHSRSFLRVLAADAGEAA